MFRGIRNSARRVALSYLQPGESTASASAGALEDLTWLEMISTGYIQMMAIERFGAGLDLSFAYMGDEALGGLLMGLVRYQDISERVEGLKSDDHVMLVGIDGSAVAGFRSNGFAVRQGGEAPISGSIIPIPFSFLISAPYRRMSVCVLLLVKRKRGL